MRNKAVVRLLHWIYWKPVDVDDQDWIHHNMRLWELRPMWEHKKFIVGKPGKWFKFKVLLQYGFLVPIMSKLEKYI